jgi:putative DNA primase/helicase
VYRYDPPGRKKEFRPWDAKRRKMAPPDPRPLYNQPGLAAAGHVVLVEGEKCAQA